MTYSEALEYIHSRPRMRNTDNRKAMRMLLELLGNPQDNLNIIHIAGTNGKGSCAKMLSNVLSCAGYKTGLNISPFVIDFRERFCIDGQFISERKLAQITEKVKEKQEYISEKYNLKLVEFEIVTAIAFCYFHMEKCDAVCLEVGIGGMFDSTNVIKNSVISCIMNISFDHTELLGDTISEIAYQKAGIIKPNQKVICYPAMDEAAFKIVKEQAEKQNSDIIVPSIKDINVQHKDKFCDILRYKDLVVQQSFAGVHQSYNTAVVIEAAMALNQTGKFKISKDNIIQGIENTAFPARIEILRKKPLVILDGAHNIDGVTALKNVLETNEVNSFTAVWASLSDKQPEKLIKMMAPFIKKLYTADVFGSRAIPKEQLAEMAKKYIPNTMASDIDYAVETAIKNGEDLLVFGSLYLAADARKIIIEKLS